MFFRRFATSSGLLSWEQAVRVASECCSKGACLESPSKKHKWEGEKQKSAGRCVTRGK